MVEYKKYSLNSTSAEISAPNRENQSLSILFLVAVLSHITYGL